MDSTASGTGFLLNTINGTENSTLSNIFVIPPRIAQPQSADSGSVYYYLETADSINNKKYYGINGETSEAPSSINNLIKLLRQDKTPLSVNTISWADTLTKTINSRSITITGNAGVIDDKANTVKIYNSEINDTVTLPVLSDTIAYSKLITFASDGQKTLIFTASTSGNLPPENSVTVLLNVDVTPPALNAAPVGRYLINPFVCVNGSVNHYTKADTVSLRVGANLYSAIFDAADSRIFSCTVAIPGTTTVIAVTATDFVGNTSVVNITVYYNASVNTETIKTFSVDSAVPVITIDTSAVIANIILGSISAGTSPVNATIIMNGADSVNINLNVTFANTAGGAVELGIKTAADSDVLAKIKANSAAEESVRKFGVTADYEAGLKTVREFNFSRNGNDINSSANFSSANKPVISFVVPSQLKGKYLSVYWFDETKKEWTPLLESQMTRGSADTISAILEHFSIYGVFTAGAPVQTNLNNVVVFPNPFRPNDGDPRTGVEFTGTLDAGNATGIHIMGLAVNSKIKIFNILGQFIDETEMLPNQGMAIWDAKNKKGEPAASGVYFIVVEGAGAKVIKKIAIIR